MVNDYSPTSREGTNQGVKVEEQTRKPESESKAIVSGCLISKSSFANGLIFGKLF